jgi:hypothetical protein
MASRLLQLPLNPKSKNADFVNYSDGKPSYRVKPGVIQEVLLTANTGSYDTPEGNTNYCTIYKESFNQQGLINHITLEFVASVAGDVLVAYSPYLLLDNLKVYIDNAKVYEIEKPEHMKILHNEIIRRNSEDQLITLFSQMYPNYVTNLISYPPFAPQLQLSSNNVVKINVSALIPELLQKINNTNFKSIKLEWRHLNWSNNSNIDARWVKSTSGNSVIDKLSISDCKLRVQYNCCDPSLLYVDNKVQKALLRNFIVKSYKPQQFTSVDNDNITISLLKDFNKSGIVGMYVWAEKPKSTFSDSESCSIHASPADFGVELFLQSKSLYKWNAPTAKTLQDRTFDFFNVNANVWGNNIPPYMLTNGDWETKHLIPFYLDFNSVVNTSPNVDDVFGGVSSADNFELTLTCARAIDSNTTFYAAIVYNQLYTYDPVSGPSVVDL